MDSRRENTTTPQDRSGDVRDALQKVVVDDTVVHVSRGRDQTFRIRCLIPCVDGHIPREERDTVGGISHIVPWSNAAAAGGPVIALAFVPEAQLPPRLKRRSENVFFLGIVRILTSMNGALVGFWLGHPKTRAW